MRAEQFGEATVEWRRSRSCVGEGHCVEVAVSDCGTQIGMRNSTAPGTVLVFDAAEWRNFVHAVKLDELPLTQ